MKVADLLRKKGHTVITITPEATVYEALKSLLHNQIGSLVVTDASAKPVGIISERDILRAFDNDPDLLKTKQVSDLMTTSLIVAIPDDDIDYVMGIMTHNRFRHIPIVDQEGLAGIISIGDIVKFQLQEIQVKNRYLEEYMYGQETKD